MVGLEGCPACQSVTSTRKCPSYGHTEACAFPVEKAPGGSWVMKWIFRALWPTTGPVTGSMHAGPEKDEPAGATIGGDTPSRSLFLLRPQEQRSHEPPSPTFPAGLFSSLHDRVCPKPSSGCMCQRIFIKMCACIYTHVHASVSMLRCV